MTYQPLNSKESQMILVTGAAGKTGKTIIQALAQRHTAVRAWVRHAAQIDAMHALGAAEVIVGDVTDTAVWQQAVAGARALYHICPNVHPQEITIGEMAITAAQAAGVRRFVFHSVLHPQTEAMPHHWRKLRVEEKLFASGLPFTILQPAAYMQNVLAYREEIAQNGRYPIPYPVATKMSLVDLADVAAAAATVLTAPGHDHAIYELAGPQPLAQSDIAAALSRRIGRSVRAVEIPLDDWERQARAGGLPDPAIDALRKMFAYYANHGFTGNSNVLRWLLGRPPTPFADFIQREWPKTINH